MSACNSGEVGSIPGSGRSPGEGKGNPLQYSCLENPMDRGAWWATVHGVAKSRTRLSDFTSLQCFFHWTVSNKSFLQECELILMTYYLVMLGSCLDQRRGGEGIMCVIMCEGRDNVCLKGRFFLSSSSLPSHPRAFPHPQESLGPVLAFAPP